MWASAKHIHVSSPIYMLHMLMQNQSVQILRPIVKEYILKAYAGLTILIIELVLINRMVGAPDASGEINGSICMLFWDILH